MSRNNVTNLSSLHRTIAYQNAKVKSTATEVYKNFVRGILKDLAKNTPQWSGDLAASWEVVIGAKGQASEIHGEGHFATPFKQIPIERPAPFFRGSKPAIDYAMKVNGYAINTLKWNNTVTIVNTNPTLPAILAITKTGDGWLRPKNYISGDIMAANFVAEKWNNKRGYGDLNLGYIK